MPFFDQPRLRAEYAMRKSELRVRVFVRIHVRVARTTSVSHQEIRTFKSHARYASKAEVARYRRPGIMVTDS